MVEETGENHRPTASHSQTLSHNVVSGTPRFKHHNPETMWLKCDNEIGQWED